MTSILLRDKYEYIFAVLRLRLVPFYINIYAEKNNKMRENVFITHFPK